MDEHTAKFSWKIAAKHAGFALLGTLVAAAIAALVAPDGANMRKVGEGAGQMAFFIMLIAAAGSYLHQKGRRQLGLLVFAACIALMVAIPVIALVARGAS